MVKAGAVAAVALLFLGAACQYGVQKADRLESRGPSGYRWQLPEGFPTPRVPPDNPMTVEKVELGRQLFHDHRMSGDGTLSCASCHRPELAYTDGLNRAVGSRGIIHPRSTMSLTNVAYNATLGWDDPTLTLLEDQVLVPLFNTQPLEMGVAGREEEILKRFRNDQRYRKLFRRAFPVDEDPISMRNVIYALASFERTLISGNSPYDRWVYGGEVDALDPDERAGARLFFSQRLNCFRCHAGFNLSGPVVYEGSGTPKAQFHNTGLYNEDGRGAYPTPNTGVHRHSGGSKDMGKFRAPTLRNIALTAPYMHDGSITTLEAVIDHYAAGGRARNIGPDSLTDNLVAGFELTSEERKQLVEFLRALTDESFVSRAREESLR
jgi:cytochrome c peroxidase